MIFSVIGVVSASEDISEDTAAEAITVSNENVYAKNVGFNEVISDLTNNGNSLKDLDSLISGSNEVNLTQDYIFDIEKDIDYSNGISINNREKLVINGNNHTINAKDNCKIFKLNSSTVVFNNII